MTHPENVTGLEGLDELIGNICVHSNSDWQPVRDFPDDMLERIHSWAVEIKYELLPALRAHLQQEPTSHE